ncbi:MAG: DUF1043 family protein [Pseudomonadales bacterium]
MEIWIVLLLAVAGLSGWAGYFLASRRAPKRAELDALAAELDEARRRAESVQAGVDEHFEQSARLFGKLAGDYREFLEHFAGSAQSLGLSETRTRELVQQSFQPLLTHEVDDLVVAAEGEGAQRAGGAATGSVEVSEAVEARDPEVPVSGADDAAPEEAVPEEAAQPVRVAEVTLNAEAVEDAVPTVERRVESTDATTPTETGEATPAERARS